MSVNLFYLCSVCFGDPSSLLSKGASAGILFLFAVIGAVLVGIAWTARSWARRARRFPGQF